MPKNTITVQDIKECTISSVIFTVFDLIDAVGYKKKQLALDIAEKIINNDESIIMIISLLTNFFFTLWRLTTLRSQNISVTELKERHLKEINPYFRDKYIQFINNYNSIQIQNAFNELYACDAKAKLSMASESVLISNLIYKIISGKK